jgi:hypothetical protein
MNGTSGRMENLPPNQGQLEDAPAGLLNLSKVLSSFFSSFLILSVLLQDVLVRGTLCGYTRVVMSAQDIRRAI